MKKIFTLACLFMLSSCLQAGDYDIFPKRNAFIEDFSTYPITFFDNKEPKLVKTEKYTEIEPAKNTIQTAYKGYSIMSDKTYNKMFFEDYYIKANKNGILNSASVPSRIHAKKIEKLIGEVTIDGVRYGLLPSELKNFVILVDDNGKIHDKMGQVKGNRLSILNADFLPAPEDLRFEVIKTTKSEQTIPVQGFEIKYNGMQLGYLNFLILDYSVYGKSKGEFESINLPYETNSNIEINGVGVRILFADEQKLDYMIIKY